MSEVRGVVSLTHYVRLDSLNWSRLRIEQMIDYHLCRLGLLTSHTPLLVGTELKAKRRVADKNRLLAPGWPRSVVPS